MFAMQHKFGNATVRSSEQMEWLLLTNAVMHYMVLAFTKNCTLRRSAELLIFLRPLSGLNFGVNSCH